MSFDPGRLGVSVKLLRSSARLPTRGSREAAGWDLYAAEERWLDVGATVVVGTGIGLGLPERYEAQIRPRSGLSSKGIWAAFGTIDSDYRGELKVILLNATGLGYRVVHGDRIAQLVVVPLLSVALCVVPQLQPTERGEGGLGSTGR